ncbi:hypothetical protein G6F63_015778 [Rhizopus arrhizus]|nr:hypothetical protein G6F63_015778 [Rhizopus arrhizus]
MPVEQDAVLDMPAHGTRQHQRFGVTAQPHQLTRCHGMVHARDVLFDDRAFVQILGDVVRGGADDLDPARVRLVIRLRTLEAGQEAVGDVDGAAAQRAAHVRRQELHVAGQHHQVGV